MKPFNLSTALYILLMVAVIVLVDVTFFKDHFWERLMANVGLVLVFLSFYLRFLRHSPQLLSDAAAISAG